MMLPEDLLWAAGGHASDVVLTALADGEDAIVPAAVRDHVAGCTACNAHLGNAALLALYTHRELGLLRTEERRPLPRAAIALGLVAAVLGLLPSLGQVDLARARLFASGLAGYARHIGNPGGLAGLLLPYLVAAVLLALGFAIVRFLPTKDHAS